MPVSRSTPTSASDPLPMMPRDRPTPELLRSLAKLLRGLSAIFWGLPLVLIATVQSQTWIGWHGLDPVLPGALHGLLLYGLSLLRRFQPGVGAWRTAIDRARLTALANLGLSPFLYLHMRLPDVPHYAASVLLLHLCGLLFLFNCNRVLLCLASMLPDEILRHDAILVNRFNRTLLTVLAVLTALFQILLWRQPVPESLLPYLQFVQLNGLWISVFPLLLPVAGLMTLTWKLKEMIMEGVFGSELWHRDMPIGAPRL